MTILYFVLILVLMLLFFLAGRAIGACRRVLWLPAAILGGLVTLALALLSYRPEFEAHLMLHPDYAFFTEAKALWAACFLLGLVLRRYRASAESIDEDHAERILRNERALRLFLLLAVLYVAFTMHWMLGTDSYTAETLPTEYWEPGLCRQTTGWSCVAASLVTLGNHIGYPESSQHEMAKRALVRASGGAADLQILRGMRLSFGTTHDTHIGRYTYDELATIPLPALTSIKLNALTDHCVVLLEWFPDHVVIADPLTGRTPLTRNEFIDRWNHVTFTVHPRDEDVQ